MRAWKALLSLAQTISTDLINVQQLVLQVCCRPQLDKASENLGLVRSEFRLQHSV